MLAQIVLAHQREVYQVRVPSFHPESPHNSPSRKSPPHSSLNQSISSSSSKKPRQSTRTTTVSNNIVLLLLKIMEEQKLVKRVDRRDTTEKEEKERKEKDKKKDIKDDKLDPLEENPLLKVMLDLYRPMGGHGHSVITYGVPQHESSKDYLYDGAREGNPNYMIKTTTPEMGLSYRDLTDIMEDSKMRTSVKMSEGSGRHIFAEKKERYQLWKMFGPNFAMSMVYYDLSLT